MYKGIIFDLDGTLLDSKLCFATMRRHLGIPKGELILEYLDTLPQHLQNEKHRQLRKLEIDAAKGSTLFPGVTDLLGSLAKRMVKVGIFTRNCREVVDWFASQIETSIDATIAREDAPPKPDPRGIFTILERWGLSAAEVLMVGDSRFDIECGRAAGVQTALFCDGSGSEVDFGADFTFDDFEVLGEKLFSLWPLT